MRGFWRAARLDYEAAARRHEDGQETLSSVLDKLAVSEDAETKLAESAYGEAMSDILLRQAIGLGSEFRQSMGIGSVGGILVSTLVSPYFIPALCACIKRRPTLNGQYGKTRT